MLTLRLRDLRRWGDEGLNVLRSQNFQRLNWILVRPSIFSTLSTQSSCLNCRKPSHEHGHCSKGRESQTSNCPFSSKITSTPARSIEQECYSSQHWRTPNISYYKKSWPPEMPLKLEEDIIGGHGTHAWGLMWS